MSFAASINVIVVLLTYGLSTIVNKAILYLQDLKEQKAHMILLFNNMPDAILHLKKV